MSPIHQASRTPVDSVVADVGASKKVMDGGSSATEHKGGDKLKRTALP